MWTNNVSEMCYARYPNSSWPICGSPTFELLLSNGTAVPFQFFVSYTKTLLKVNVWTNDDQLAGQTFDVKLKGFNSLIPNITDFSQIFSVKILKGIQTIGNNPPDFRSFPSDMAFYQGKSYEKVEAVA